MPGVQGERAGPAQQARRRLRPAGRDDDRRGRLQLPHPLHPPASDRPPDRSHRRSARTIRRGRSAGSTGTRRFRAAACSSPRSAAPGSTASAGREDSSGRSSAPVSYPSDPQPLPGGRILLADYASPGAAVILNHHGRVLWRYGPASGWGALDHPPSRSCSRTGTSRSTTTTTTASSSSTRGSKRIVWQYGHLARPGRGGRFSGFRTGWTTSRSASTRSLSGSSYITRDIRRGYGGILVA